MVTKIGDSPAIGGLITGQGTTRQVAAARIVEDAAPAEVGLIALQTTVG